MKFKIFKYPFALMLVSLSFLQTADAQTYSKLAPSDRKAFLKKYHSDRLNSIQAQWVADLSRLGIQSPPKLVETPNT